MTKDSFVFVFHPLTSVTTHLAGGPKVNVNRRRVGREGLSAVAEVMGGFYMAL